jgi:hypothetical protein
MAAASSRVRPAPPASNAAPAASTPALIPIVFTRVVVLR